MDNNSHLIKMDATHEKAAKSPEGDPRANSESEVIEDSDYTSSSGSSSEADETEETTQSTAQSTQPSQIREVPTKTKMDGDLKSRLAAFIPQLQRANQELEANEDLQAHRIDHVDDHADRYIEMDLGLGVLSRRRHDEGVVKLGESESEDESTFDDETEETRRIVIGHGSKPQQTSTGGSKIEEI